MGPLWYHGRYFSSPTKENESKRNESRVPLITYVVAASLVAALAIKAIDYYLASIEKDNAPSQSFGTLERKVEQKAIPKDPTLK
jgi:hypothetical protein